MFARRFLSLHIEGFFGTELLGEYAHEQFLRAVAATANRAATANVLSL
jgi:hypothetical protein